MPGTKDNLMIDFLAGVSRRSLLIAALAAAPWRPRPGPPSRSTRGARPAGGTQDVVARILSEAIAAEIGQPVIVDNKPGAGGTIGLQALNSAAPDGQTLMFTASNVLTEVPLVLKTGSTRPRTSSRSPWRRALPWCWWPPRGAGRQREGAGRLPEDGHRPGQELRLVLARHQLPLRLHDLRQAGRAGPAAHPVRGFPPALQNLMGNQTIMFDGLATSLPQIKAGKIKVLGWRPRPAWPSCRMCPPWPSRATPTSTFPTGSASSRRPEAGRADPEDQRGGDQGSVDTGGARKLLAHDFIPAVSASPRRWPRHAARVRAQRADRQELRHQAQPVTS
jgi:hypothetical protein